MVLNSLGSGLLYSCIVGILLAILVTKFLSVKREPLEPPYIDSKIPFIGHALGLYSLREKYYNNLRERHPDFPIYSLDIFGSRNYIINSPELAVAVQRNAPTLSFYAYGVKLAESLCGLSGGMMSIMNKNLEIVGDTTNFAFNYFKNTHESLSYAGNVEELIQSALPKLTMSAVSMLDSGAPHEIHLSRWIRQVLVSASTSAVYGTEYNPLKDQTSRDGYQKFEDGMLRLVLSPFASLLASDAYSGREATAEAMKNYIERNHQNDGSKYCQSRYQLCFSYGMAKEDVARLDLGGLTALNSNASPAAFWLLAAIISRPELFQQIRNEATNNGVLIPDPKEPNTYIYSAAKTWENCPLLISTFREVLRYYALGATIRLVLQDTSLDGRYLLKKGGLVMIPTASMHRNSDMWGSDADKFDPYRFLKLSKNSSTGKATRDRSDDEHSKERSNHKVPRGAFRAFGGGTSLCPGRHFATSEILTLVGLLVLLYDFEPADGPKWKLPQMAPSKMTAAMETPLHDLRVRARQAEEYIGKVVKLYIPKQRGMFDIQNIY